jgi:superfamily II DNA/RNA helicase
MINANNLSGAIRELGGRVGSGQEISDVLTANIRRRLERLNYDRTYISNSPYVADNDKVRRLSKIDKDINSLQSQLDSITNRINNLDDEECVICCCSYTEPVCLDCTHVFCSECILKWIQVRTRVHQKAECPYCKRIINLANMHKIDINAKTKKKGQSEKKSEEVFGKDETIIKIIEKNPNGKFIIFSNHYESFDSFENLLTTNRNIQKKCKRLVGNTNTVAKTLRDFEKNRLDIILLNSQYNGAGIDLPTATHVILYHKMRKDLEKQVIGRALRIGRPKSLPLVIHRLKYDNEYNN